MKKFIFIISIFFNTISVAQEDIVWHTDKIASRGVACHFETTPNYQQDAYVTTAGPEIAIIFTKLGSVFRDGRREGVKVSNCVVQIPVEIPSGLYVDTITQTIGYGIIKGPGVAVNINAEGSFVRAKPNDKINDNDRNRSLFEAFIHFPNKDEINIPFDFLNPNTHKRGERKRFATNRILRDNNPDSGFGRFCHGNRTRLMAFNTIMKIRANFTDPNAALAVNIDGTDLRLETAMTFAQCTERPRKHFIYK